MRLQNGEWNIDITIGTGGEAPTWADPLLEGHHGEHAGLLDLLRDFKAKSNARRFDVELVAGAEYKYKITHSDGRKWRQRMRVAGGTAFSMTFNVPDFWTEAELRTGRGSMMVATVRLLGAFPDITKIEVEWLT